MTILKKKWSLGTPVSSPDKTLRRELKIGQSFLTSLFIYIFSSLAYDLTHRSRDRICRTSLIQTPKGQIEVSVLERSPYKRGHYDEVIFMTRSTYSFECSVS